MKNVTRDTFRALFEAQLCLLKNPVCERCDAKVRSPLLPWIVGGHFAEAPERIMFVGKPHRGRPGDILPSGLIDPTNEVAKKLWNGSWAYWSYTREVVERLYGRNAADYITLTNLIKCTNVDAGSSVDATTEKMARCCVSELGVLWKEVERLQPLTLVFYTYGLFRNVIRSVPVALEGSVREVTPENYFVTCGKKCLPWWERECRTPWTEKLRILVTGHPERMNRHDFVQRLVGWLRPEPVIQPTGSAGG